MKSFLMNDKCSLYLLLFVGFSSFILLLDPFGFIYPSVFSKRNKGVADEVEISHLNNRYKTDWKFSDDPNVINVHLIPHTHDDAGWQVSVDEYQLSQVDVILDNIFLQLEANVDRRFTYAETNFFAAWFRRQPIGIQSRVRKLVQQGRLEIVNGGWVQHDEAGPVFGEMIDQTTRGHLWLKKHLDICPTVAWQLDPFGHSQTQAWLLSSKAGMNSLFFGRSDYRELAMRYANASLEYLWEGSKSFGSEARVFAVQLFGQGKYGGYYSWYPFEETNARDRNYVQDDPTMQGYNVPEWIDKIVKAATHQASQTKTNHQMWMLGNDFTFQSASRWFGNYDKLIHYVNLDGRIRIFYSTPSNYVKAKQFYGGEWEVRMTDLFPLADGPHEYWTGYFTSRPSLKRQYRYASAFLQTARQIETLMKIDHPDIKLMHANDSEARTTTSPLGVGWTDELEGALAVVAHHDGVSGTARQSVTNDYSYRLALGSVRAEKSALQALEKIAQISPGGAGAFCNCNSGGPKNCLMNMSTCSFTSNHDAFTVVMWNSLPRTVEKTIDIPVMGGKFHVRNDDGTIISSSLIEIDPTTKGLPIRYLNDYGLTPSEIWDQLLALQNPATHRLIFPIAIPGLGYRIIRVSASATVTSDDLPDAARKLNAGGLLFNAQEEKESTEDIFGLENEYYKIEVDPFTNMVLAIVNKKIKRRFPFEIEWGYYRSSIGGCTKEKPEPDACMSQTSGAYLFRPNSTNLHWSIKKPIYSKIKRAGPLIEVNQKFASWISHTIRLDSSSNSVQVEWTVGPIPIEDDWGKEVVVRYRAMKMNTAGKFYTDSNGREMVERCRNKRSKDVCTACTKTLKYEPVSSNYYPVNAYLSVHDDTHEFTVLVDATHGGTSLNDGEIELMVHRRVLKDDFRGVEEPLNETMCGCGDINARPGEMGVHGRLGDGGCVCEGLTIRGRHFLVLDSQPEARKIRRMLGNEIGNPPQLAFFENDFSLLPGKNFNYSAIMKPNFVLPESAHLLTFTSNYENGTLVRFSHSFEKDEHPELSGIVTFSMKEMFKNKIKSVAEYSLSGNQPIENIKKQQEIWSTNERGTPENKRAFRKQRINDDNSIVTLRPMEVKTYWVKFEENK